MKRTTSHVAMLLGFTFTPAVGAQPLHDAVYRNEAGTVAELIAAGEDVNAPNSIGSMPLHWAALRDSREAAAALIAAGAGLDAKDADGEAPLHTAARNGSVGVAELLVERGANVDARDTNGRSPLHTALGRGEVRIATLLVKSGAALEARDAGGATPLHFAVHDADWRTGGPGAIVALLDAGADLEARDDVGRTPLHRALMDFRDYKFSDNSDTVALLLHAGADVHLTTRNGCGVLHFAALERAAESAELLLEAGAAVSGGAERFGECPDPLVYALHAKANEVALLLIDRGAEIGIRDADGNTMLAVALARGLDDVVHRLIRRDETLTANEAEPGCLLYAAVWTDADDELRKLEARGVGLDQVGCRHGVEGTLLHVAAMRDSHTVTPWLIEHGADLDGTDAGGDPPLLVAVRHGAANVARLLLEAGADVDLADDEGKSLLALAVESHADNAGEPSGSPPSADRLALGAKRDYGRARRRCPTVEPGGPASRRAAGAFAGVARQRSPCRPARRDHAWVVAARCLADRAWCRRRREAWG